MKNKRKRGDRLVFITCAVLLLLTVSFAISMFFRGESECVHDFSEYIITKAATDFTQGEKIRSCKKCDIKETQVINATIPLPQLYLDGSLEGISKTSDVVMRARYFENENVVESYASIKYQGHTSLMFEKKNYTIKFYEDELGNSKKKISVNGWEPTHKYCLKANFIDYSSSRNVVSSNIWSDVVRSRKNLNENIAELEFLGGIDGIPTALFINGKYSGLYTFNIPKDEDTYGIADEENEAMFVINSGMSDAANFKSALTEEDKQAVYDLEYSYDDDMIRPYESMDRLIKFVMDNEGDAFKKDAYKYLDVDAAIDYLITAYVLGLTDNFAKNMILLTYDGDQWIPNMYDLDTACGLAFDGTKLFEYDFCLPHISDDGTVSSGTEMLLWDRILNSYASEFKSRYFELRENVLKTENVTERYEAFISSIPDECYAKEILLYPDIPFSETDQLRQITEFLQKRCELLDVIIEQFE